MNKKIFSINPIKKTILVKGFSCIQDNEYSIDTFREICFQNNWEGTLFKVEGFLNAFDEAIFKEIQKMS